MGEAPKTRHGLIPMLVAIRVAGERRRREAALTKDGERGAEPPKTKKKRGWFR